MGKTLYPTRVLTGGNEAAPVRLLPLGKIMHTEFKALREAARLEPNAEERNSRLAEIDDMERMSQEVEKGIAALKKNIEVNGHQRKFLGLRVGTPLEWLLVIGLPTIILTIANTLDLTYKETGALAALFVLPICAVCLIAALRLKARVQAQKEQSSHLLASSKAMNRPETNLRGPDLRI